MVRFWFDEGRRLEAAKSIQRARLNRIREQWIENRSLRDAGFSVDTSMLLGAIEESEDAITTAPDVVHLLTEEARLTKKLYKFAARSTEYGNFVRGERGSGTDPANRFLDHGNYLAYGLAATAAWVLGIPHGLAVLHGKTRRGGLVFDVADLVKDAVILPQAFISAVRGEDEQQFRQACLESLTQSEALDFMIETLKSIAQHLGIIRA